MKIKSLKVKRIKVKIGNVEIGDKNPIRIQSMTNTKTSDIEKTICQILNLYEKGCELVRVSIQNKKELLSFDKIKNILIKKNHFIPLIADLHFSYSLALASVEVADKIRINPGNFLKDVKTIEEKFLPFLEKCKKFKTPIRIGVNKGSLPEHISKRFNKKPALAMVEAALEYLKICEKNNFKNLVISLKSSNVLDVISAYRIIFKRMEENNVVYPLHIGLTEAGEGVYGRIKSTIGIGTLLLEGIGDTIRVSLTEDPEKEIPVAKKIIYFSKNSYIRKLHAINNNFKTQKDKNFKKKKKEIFDKNFSSINCLNFLLRNSIPISVVVSSTSKNKYEIKKEDGKTYQKVGWLKKIDKILLEDKNNPSKPKTEENSYFINSDTIQELKQNKNNFEEFLKNKESLIFHTSQKNIFKNFFELYGFLKENKIYTPLVFFKKFSFNELKNKEKKYNELKKEDLKETLIIKASLEFGYLLLNDFIEGVCLGCNFLEDFEKIEISSLIIQACKKRFFSPEYISCPGCTRTNFDIQKITKRIKEKTSHLNKNIKIAIMGCIVNGPGEMENADFGIVGKKKDEVDIYFKRKKILEKINIFEAEKKLLEIIEEVKK